MNENIAYYVSGHTAQGYVNLLHANVVNIEKIISIQHPSLRVKTNLFQQLMNQNESPVEVLRSPEGKQYIEGIIFRHSNIAFIDEHLVTKSLVERVTNINITTNMQAKDRQKEERLARKLKKLQESAYKNFQEALQVHHHIEQIYIREMDFERANELSTMWKEKLIPPKQLPHKLKRSNGEKNTVERQNNDKTEKYVRNNQTSEQAIVYERFFGTNTPEGIVHNLQNLISPLKRRIFIKGRAGTGKSFFMSELLTAALEKGYTIEKYRCSFDPLSVDMGIIRELNCCFFDSTGPHELLPERKDDTIVDLYELTVTKGTDEKYADELARLQTDYKEKVQKGLNNLRKTKQLRDEKEALYREINEKDVSFILKSLVNSKF